MDLMELTTSHKLKIVNLLLNHPDTFIAIYREKILYVSPGILEKFGYTVEELKSTYIWDLMADERTKEMVKRMVLKRLYEGYNEPKAYSHLPVRKKNGEVAYIYDLAFTIELEDGRAVLAIGFDFTKEHLQEENLRKERTNQILSSISDVICLLDKEGVIRYISPSVKNIVGMPESHFLMRSVEEVLSHHLTEESIKSFKEMLSAVFQERDRAISTSLEVELNGRRKFFEVHIQLPDNWEEIGLEGPILSARDVTEVKLIEQKLVGIRYYDLVTGLPRRALVTEKMEKMLAMSQREGHYILVVVLDMKGLENVNMIMGQGAKERVLKEVSNRLLKNLRVSDLVGKLSEEQFLVIVSGVKDTSKITNILDKIRRVLNITLHHEDMAIELYPQMGASLFPVDGTSAEELVEKAEIALYLAKLKNRDYLLFSEKLWSELERKLKIREELKRAISNREIKNYYQPIFDTDTLKVSGIEALARWFHPKKGMIPPAEFIPVAEENNLITDLGHLVAEQALRDLSRLREKGFKNLWVSINLSPKQFFEPELMHRFSYMAERFNINPQYIVLEITEDATFEDPQKASSIINGLKNLGFKIGIDDFGKGYSYLSHLVDLEVDILKIDMDFIIKMLDPENTKVRRIVKTIIDLSHSMGAMCIAEGVENKQVIQELRDMGCDAVQGFYLAKPMDFVGLISLL